MKNCLNIFSKIIEIFMIGTSFTFRVTQERQVKVHHARASPVHQIHQE